ncbi:hypothetical protein [Natranaerofaba carboxydovora]|uniref:hypothetical protein n=1 Tax=Natranaerofaba carboxydovora TaxID=2742683 RepID=UPI001F148C58|nr:hypothetical protein [Natranaerofaba carboxydovora]UMZ72955.1 hypothetical protein ACONDI_00494 [Natranaerofaba carboxydovora]
MSFRLIGIGILLILFSFGSAFAHGPSWENPPGNGPPEHAAPKTHPLSNHGPNKNANVPNFVRENIFGQEDEDSDEDPEEEIYNITFTELNETENIEITVYEDKDNAKKKLDSITTDQEGKSDIYLTKGDYFFAVSADYYKNYERSFSVEDTDIDIEFEIKTLSEVMIVSNQDELNKALKDEKIATIILQGTFDSFKIDRNDITILGGTINYSDMDYGIKVDNVTGILIDGVTVKEDSDKSTRAIKAMSDAEFTLKDSKIITDSTAIYLHDNPLKGGNEVEFTAKDNIIKDAELGISGTRHSVLNEIESNTFENCTVGINLDRAVTSTVIDVEDEGLDALYDYLKNNNDFINFDDNIKIETNW